MFKKSQYVYPYVQTLSNVLEISKTATESLTRLFSYCAEISVARRCTAAGQKYLLVGPNIMFFALILTSLTLLK
jgi:hypothetical protein